MSDRLSELRERYAAFRERGLALDMTRGKPSPEQLDLSGEMLSLLGPDDYRDAAGTDCRNYGGLDGLPEAKQLFARFLEVGEDEILIGGNASLTLMHDIIARCLSHGACDSDQPWSQLGSCKFLCPAPGYDRHFTICEHFGIEMIPVEMTAEGPDVDQLERLTAENSNIKGIWLVPKYGNPTGVSFSDRVVDRLASMQAAPDFRIIWDNAYTVHHLTDTPDRLRNILEACKAAGNPNRPFIIGSTSKVTFAGAGISMVGGSTDNIAWIKRHLAVQTIGPDKLNQLRHVRFFGDMAGIEAHMRKHAAILKPKFEAVGSILENELGGQDIASWSSPNGGYFISLDVPDGCARQVVAMAADAGVKLTGAGATFPYKNDPRDRNIRLAPSLPSLEQINQAMEIVAVCVQIAALEK